MSTLDAFWLPGLDDHDIRDWHRFDAGPFALRAPRLTPDGMMRLAHRLRTAQERLAAQPLARIIDAIDVVAARLLDHDDPLRSTLDQALPPLTGYSPPMIRLILDRMAADWRRHSLERLVDTELAGGAMLDSVTRQRGRSFIAVPWPLLVHVFAGNIPGVAVTSLVRALLVRSASLGKTASGEPLVAPLFAAALAAHDPVIGDALAITYWPGADIEIARAAFRAADAVVVYGGSDALASARTIAPPATPVIDHGPRLSAAFIARETRASASADDASGADASGADAHGADPGARNARGADPGARNAHGADPGDARLDALAADAATAVATFDQQGCVSPHAIYVEDDALDARLFALALSDHLAALQRTLPRARLTSDEAAALHAARARAEFGAFAGAESAGTESAGTESAGAESAGTGSAGTGAELVSPPDAPFIVVFHGTPGFEPSCLLRTVHVYRVPSIDDALNVLAPNRALLQSAAVAGGDALLRRRIALAGFTRITSLADMAWPDFASHHDGRGPLTELLRFVAVER